MLPHIALLLAVMLLGLSFVGIRAIMMDQDAPASLGFLRYGIATLMLLPFLWWRRIIMPPLHITVIIAALGVLQFGFFHLFVNTALEDISASRGAVIFALIPILTMLIAAMAGRDTLNAIKLFAAILSFIGVALAIGEKAFTEGNASTGWTGELLFFMAVCCGATYNAFASRVMQNRSVVLMTIVGMSAGTMAIFPFAYAEGLGSAIRGYDTGDWLWILYLAGPIAPIMAAAFGALILDEHLSSLFLLGLACAVSGPIILNWRRTARQSKP